MALDKQFPVYGDDGLKGTLFAPARFLDSSTQKRVRLEDGREIVVPSESLVPAPDGSFYLKNASAFLVGKPSSGGTTGPTASVAEKVAPPPVEAARKEPPKAEVPPKVEIPPKVETPRVERTGGSDPQRMIYNPSLGDALFREDCDVKRVPIRKLIDKPVEPRQEGDTWIVPMVEEVLIVEKRLLLREELHITRRREQRPDPKPMRLEDLQLDGK
jgi:hypothetical protein